MPVTELSSTPSPTDIAAVRAVPQRIVEAWSRHDADAFAQTFTEDGTMILPHDVFAQGAAGIRAFMAGAFAGPYRGTQVTGTPVHVRLLGPDVCVLITRGGVLRPGETEVAEDHRVLATWILHRQDGTWKVAAYQNTPAAA